MNYKKGSAVIFFKTELYMNRLFRNRICLYRKSFCFRSLVKKPSVEILSQAAFRFFCIKNGKGFLPCSVKDFYICRRILYSALYSSRNFFWHRNCALIYFQIPPGFYRKRACIQCNHFIFHQPIAPSISSFIRLFISTAYSSGSSLATGFAKPVTIICLASVSLIPRLIR